MKKDNLRPDNLDGYIGQDQIKEQLAAAMASAKARQQPLPHVLLSGPPGLGKTTLALIIANEMGTELLDLIGSTAGNPLGLSKKIMELGLKKMLFIDEIHALRKPVQEVLYPVLEDGRLLYRLGNASAEFPLPPLTIIGATTDLGKLTQPFLDRFQLNFELQFYEYDELEAIGRITAQKLDLELPDAAMELVAMRSRATPRIMNNNLKWLRDFKIYKAWTALGYELVEEVMWNKLRLDPEGLRPLDRNYLRVLAEGEKPIGLDALSARLRQAAVTLEKTVEPYLLYSGFVERTGTGRTITAKGRSHLDLLKQRRKGKI